MMRASSRRELYKLRELTHFLLGGAGATPRNDNGTLCCYFCKKRLDDYSEFTKHGNAVGPKFIQKLSIHHRDGNHENNEPSNKALCHTSCHKSHHRREENLKRSQVTVDLEIKK